MACYYRLERLCVRYGVLAVLPKIDRTEEYEGQSEQVMKAALISAVVQGDF